MTECCTHPTCCIRCLVGVKQDFTGRGNDTLAEAFHAALGNRIKGTNGVDDIVKKLDAKPCLAGRRIHVEYGASLTALAFALHEACAFISHAHEMVDEILRIITHIGFQQHSAIPEHARIPHALHEGIHGNSQNADVVPCQSGERFKTAPLRLLTGNTAGQVNFSSGQKSGSAGYELGEIICGFSGLQIVGMYQKNPLMCALCKAGSNKSGLSVGKAGQCNGSVLMKRFFECIQRGRGKGFKQGMIHETSFHQ